MDLIADILENGQNNGDAYKSITVTKPLDVEYDLGTLLCLDKNELDMDLLRSQKEDYVQSLTRDNVQLLFNKIWELPTEKVDDIIVVKLPKQTMVLPRARCVPKPKPLTRWQEFAKSKGIQKKKKGKRQKLSWDEQLQKWIPLYGYRRAEATKTKDWVLEVPQNADPMEDQFAKKAEAKSERVAKNELQRLRNIAKSKNIKVPRMGLLNPDVSTAKDLQAAVTVARSSTASVGKFQSALPKEKDTRGIAAITPGSSSVASSRKRKSDEMSGEQPRRSEQNAKRPKVKHNNSGKKKPKSGKKKPKSGNGRKRR